MIVSTTRRRAVARIAIARLVAFTAATLVGIACANQTMPPGGPPDAAPPLVVGVTPKDQATGAKLKSLDLRFDEVISETPLGGRDLSDLVFISPKSGRPEVSWHRNRMSIRPSKGWKANTVYSVLIRPGIQDLRNNTLDTAITVVFSTGGAIPDTRLSGVAFDWREYKGLANAVVEAIAADSKDSTTYQVAADSAGRYALKNLPAGPYILRAYEDRNKNRELDPLEQWDSVRVTLTQTFTTDLYAFQRDTVGLRIADIAVQDSNRVLKVTFDKPYPSTQFFVTEGVLLKAADSALIRVRLVQTSAQKTLFDSVRAQFKADSTARANPTPEDTNPLLRARRDSVLAVRRVDSIAAADRARRAAAQAAARAAQQANRGATRRVLTAPDTLPLPKPQRPRVYTEIFVTLEAPLPPQTQFRLQVNGVRSLNDVVKSPSRTFSTARADTTKRDTTARKPPGGALRQ